MADGRAKYLALSEEDKKLCEEERKAAVADGTFIPKESPKKKVPLPPKQKKYKRTIYFRCLVKKHRRQKKRSPIHRTVLLLRHRSLLRRRCRRLLGLLWVVRHRFEN